VPNLTAAQQAALKADIAANAATIPAGQPWTNGFAGVQVKNVPNTPDGNATLAGFYNQTAAPDYFVWDRAADAFAIFNQVTFANYTPNDAAAETLIDGNRAMRCQIKQGNIALLLQGRTSFDAQRRDHEPALGHGRRRGRPPG
jgi:hypothetical protein